MLPELLTGVVFAASAWIAQTEPGSESARALRLAGLCWLAAFALAAVWIDAAVQRLPDILVLPAGTGAILLTTAAALSDARPGAAGRVVLAAMLTAALFLVLALLAGVGLGDLKLAGALAAALGYDSYSTLLRGIAAAFVLAGLFTLLRYVVDPAHRGARLALGPFLFAGCFLVLLLR
jgi:leader peptidase (prepilin peptidase)/N-methyltransferase